MVPALPGMQTPDPVVQEGVVAKWNGSFGFIHFDDGRRGYVHQSACGNAPLVEGQNVLARLVEDPRNPDKWQAVDVERVAAVAQDSSGRLRGEVVQWNGTHGFIHFTDGTRAFVHHTGTNGLSLSIGEWVIGYIESDAKNPGKWMARNVEVVGKSDQDDNALVQSLTEDSRGETLGDWTGMANSRDSRNDNSRLEGSVASWNNANYGFIHFSDGRRAYCHRSQCGDEALREGDVVTGLVEEDPVNPGKWQAKAVEKKSKMPQKGSIVIRPPIAHSADHLQGPQTYNSGIRPNDHSDDHLQGVVSQWSGTYGFINFNDGRRAYVHNSQIAEGTLYEGQAVVAQITQDPRNPGKWQAFDVAAVQHSELPAHTANGVRPHTSHTEPQGSRGDWSATQGGRPPANPNQGGHDRDSDALQGVVSEWKPGSSYGFIQFADGRRAYVHVSQCGNYGAFSEGQCVVAFVVDDPQNIGKFQAVCVEPSVPKIIDVPFRHTPAQSEGPVVNGTVVQWNASGFGFLDCVDGRRAYVHASAFGGQHLQVGEVVTATLQEDARNAGKWSVARVIGVGLVETPEAKHSPHARSQPLEAHEMKDQMKGTVSEWNPRGFGFVMLDDGRRAYVHSTQCPLGEHLEQGETIIATIVPDPNKPGKWAAQCVEKVDNLAPSEFWEPPAKRKRYSGLNVG